MLSSSFSNNVFNCRGGHRSISPLMCNFYEHPNKSLFLFNHIVLHHQHLSKTKIKPVSMTLGLPPAGQVCTHASPTCTVLPAGYWEAWPQHTHSAFKSLVHMLEADRKSDGHPCKHRDRHYCHRPVQDETRSTICTIHFVQRPVREGTDIPDKQKDKKKRGYYYFKGNINPSSFLQYVLTHFSHRPLT